MVGKIICNLTPAITLNQYYCGKQTSKEPMTTMATVLPLDRQTEYSVRIFWIRLYSRKQHFPMKPRGICWCYLGFMVSVCGCIHRAFGIRVSICVFSAGQLRNSLIGRDARPAACITHLQRLWHKQVFGYAKTRHGRHFQKGGWTSLSPV